MSLTGKELKEKFPNYAKQNKVEDDDVIFLAGDKIKILREKKD